ncbi:MAG: hypothetical protein QHH09_01560 [Microgenomates group bacterium]|nr:hypothetical protein [Microgenomates group bacterium]
MIPIVLIASDLKKIDDFVKNFSQQRKIMPNYIFRIFPENKEFSINQIRKIKKEIIFLLKETRLYILYNFHISSLEAQNAFLKTLEEAPNQIQFILTVDNQYQLIPTIISRSKIIILDKFHLPLVDKNIVQSIDLLIKKQDLRIFSIENNDLINQLIIYFKNRLADDPKAAKVLKEILNVNNLIKSNNLDLRLAYDHLLIFIKNTYSPLSRQ